MNEIRKAYKRKCKNVKNLQRRTSFMVGYNNIESINPY